MMHSEWAGSGRDWTWHEASKSVKERSDADG